jgi:hypothetical protein
MPIFHISKRASTPKKYALVGLLDGESIRIGDIRLITSRQGNRGSTGNVAQKQCAAKLYHANLQLSCRRMTFA